MPDFWQKTPDIRATFCGAADSGKPNHAEAQDSSALHHAWDLAEDCHPSIRRAIDEALQSANTQLPPDPESMNDDRAEWAAAALRHFQCTTGTDYDNAFDRFARRPHALVRPQRH
jgi:hypothetical protein